MIHLAQDDTLFQNQFNSIDVLAFLDPNTQFKKPWNSIDMLDK